MLDITQINDIIIDVLKTEKKAESLKVPYWDSRKKPVEFYPGYNMNVQAHEEIRVHAVRGVYPEKIIESRAPNMTDMEKNYVAANYKQITLPVYVDFVNTVKRAFSDNNWSIEYPNDEGEEGGYRWYVEKGIANTRTKMSVESYIKNVVPSIKTIDAMGCVVVKPERQVLEVIDGEIVIGNDLLEPVPQYYSIEQLRAFDEGDWYLFLTHEHSDVMVGNRKERTGFIYELYDRKAIYRIVQIGAKKDNEYRIDVYFQHDSNEVPVKRLEGIPEYTEGVLSWLSPFSYAVPLLDDAIIDANMLRGVKATTMFPYRIMVGNICEHKMDLNGEKKCCDGRGWFDDFDNDTLIKCPACFGSGLRDRISPNGQMLMRPEATGEQGELKASQPAMYYVAPGVEVPKFTREEIREHISDARKILHIRESTSEVKGNVDMTATEAFLDEKAITSFIKPISDQIFEMYEFILKWIGIERYGEEQEVILVAPITFDYKSEYDYLMEISMAIKNGLPPFVVQTIVFKYLKTLFYNQLESAQAFNVIVRADRLLTMDNDQVALKLSKGIIAPWEVVLHDSAITMLMEMVAENPRFFDQEQQVQVDQLVERAKQIASETKASTPQSPLSLVDSIINRNGAA